MESVGMVGAGAMGRALLERLKLAGIQATVYDPDPAALEQARSIGAQIAGSSAEVAESSTLVDVVVRTDQDVLDCIVGHKGLLEAAHAGTLVLLHSTILPQTTEQAEKAAHRRAVFVLDACMAGVPDTVLKGDLTFLVGGPSELVDRAKPHLLKMGNEVLHMGSLGAGNVAKLMENLVMGAETLILHEAIQLGRARDLSYPESLKMLRQIYMGTVLDRWEEVFDPSGNDMTPRTGRNLFGKDIPLAAELGRIYGLDLPITEQLGAVSQRIVGRRGF